MRVGEGKERIDHLVNHEQRQLLKNVWLASLENYLDG